MFFLNSRMQKRKQRELDYRACEARSRALLNSTAHAILGVDDGGNCSFCNPSSLKLLGYESMSELLGKSIHQFLYTGKGNNEKIISENCGICQVCNRGTTTHIEETTLWREDGTSFPAELWALPVVINGKTEGGVVTFVDITNRLEQQKRNIRMAQLASLGELSANISHEINNPINGVINYTQILLNNGSETEEQSRLLEQIMKEGERVAAIVNNMLEYSRDTGGKMVQEELKPLVLKAIALLEAQIKRAGVVVNVDFENNFPPIHCNAQQIEQVLVNIVRNALQALIDNHPNDRVLSISAEKISENNENFIKLTIANNGPPIPKTLISKILNPFVTTKPVGVGTGLGLSISADIMKRHNGKFEVESDPGGLTQMILQFSCNGL